MRLWICGKYVLGLSDGPTCWEFQGVFFMKKKAVKACRDKNYFVAPTILNKALPDEPTNWPGLEYPLN